MVAQEIVQVEVVGRLEDEMVVKGTVMVVVVIETVVVVAVIVDLPQDQVVEMRTADLVVVVEDVDHQENQVAEQEVDVDFLENWVVKQVVETDLDTFAMVVEVVVASAVGEDPPCKMEVDRQAFFFFTISR